METKEIEAYVAKQIELSPKLRPMLDEQSGKPQPL